MSTLEQAARKALEWMEGAWYQIDCEWGPCGKTLDQACADGDAPEIEALRAALAQPAAPAPERVPLTDTEIYALAEEESKDHFINFRVFSLGVKAAERAHGITKEPQR